MVQLYHGPWFTRAFFSPIPSYRVSSCILNVGLRAGINPLLSKAVLAQPQSKQSSRHRYNHNLPELVWLRLEIGTVAEI